jgi:DNA modification methylase
MDDKPYEMNENGRHPYNVVTDSIAELTYPTNVMDVKKPRGGESIKEHQTQKPLALMRWLIGLTTLPGQTVLDCFGGTGTTGEAALLDGRKIVLIEREAKYIEIIEERLKPYMVETDFIEY